jgi:hypothetical protein
MAGGPPETRHRQPVRLPGPGHRVHRDLHDLDEPARARLGFEQRVPAGTTVWRLLTRLDEALLTTVLAGWLRTAVSDFILRRADTARDRA